MSEWVYGFREIGPCETRHEAIGKATVRAGGIHPPEYWRHVMAARSDDVCDGLNGFGTHEPADGDPEDRCLFCGQRGVA